MAIKDSFSYITYAFYSRYNTVWRANTEIGLDPKNGVIKRLRVHVYSHQVLHTVKILKFRTVMHPKDVEGIANSVDPDQTAPLGAV